jgi:hypothetical protein
VAVTVVAGAAAVVVEAGAVEAGAVAVH